MCIRTSRTLFPQRVVLHEPGLIQMGPAMHFGIRCFYVPTHFITGLFLCLSYVPMQLIICSDTVYLRIMMQLESVKLQKCFVCVYLII